MNDPRRFPGFSIGRRRLLTYAVSSPVVTIASGFGVNLATPSSALADPQIQWSAHMETGDLSEWLNPPGAGEEVDDPGCTTVAIGTDGAVHPHSGNYMMKQTVPAQGGGTRMQRYPEVDRLSRTTPPTTYYYSFWHYLPSAISYGSSDTYIVWGLNSSAGAGLAGDPFWSLVLASSSNNGTGALDLVWNRLNRALGAGPHNGESGGKQTYAGLDANRLMIGHWNFIEIMITPAPDFTGAIKVWQNGTLIHDQSPTSANGLGGVKTQWPINNQDLLAWFGQDGYGSGLTPTPTINYVDDVTISLGRIPPTIWWSADMETGDLSQWFGADDNPIASSTAVTAASAGITAHGGSWVMKQSVTGSGGTRMNVFPGLNSLSQAGTTFYASWWHYFPERISFGSGDQYNFWQIASRDSGGVYAPIWALYVDGSNFTPILIWMPWDGAPALSGPHNGETGKQIYRLSSPAVPIASWVFFEIMCTPSAGFTGALKIWMNGQVMFDLSLIKTRYPDGGVGGLMYTTHNAYGSGLSPTPAVHYVDDVTYSLGRLL